MRDNFYLSFILHNKFQGNVNLTNIDLINKLVIKLEREFNDLKKLSFIGHEGKLEFWLFYFINFLCFSILCMYSILYESVC